MSIETTRSSAGRKKSVVFQHAQKALLITWCTIRCTAHWNGVFSDHFPIKETRMDVNNVTGGVAAVMAGVVLQIIGMVILIVNYGFYLESFWVFWILGVVVTIGGMGFAGLEVVREKMNE